MRSQTVAVDRTSIVLTLLALSMLFVLWLVS
jgi:hypothetical protein